jgi:hypothetical protein
LLVRFRAEGGLAITALPELMGSFELFLMNSSRVKASASSFGVEAPFEVFRIVVTWLILPVVICLSQRLSHACLSINKFVL